MMKKSTGCKEMGISVLEKQDEMKNFAPVFIFIWLGVKSERLRIQKGKVSGEIRGKKYVQLLLGW